MFFHRVYNPGNCLILLSWAPMLHACHDLVWLLCPIFVYSAALWNRSTLLLTLKLNEFLKKIKQKQQKQQQQQPYIEVLLGSSCYVPKVYFCLNKHCQHCCNPVYKLDLCMHYTRLSLLHTVFIVTKFVITVDVGCCWLLFSTKSNKPRASFEFFLYIFSFSSRLKAVSWHQPQGQRKPITRDRVSWTLWKLRTEVWGIHSIQTAEKTNDVEHLLLTNRTSFL